MRDAEPELHGGVAVDCLRYVEAKRRALDQRQPGYIHAQTETKGMGDGTDFVTVHIRVAGIVEGSGINVPYASHMIAEIPLPMAHEGNAPLQARHPHGAALPLVDVKAPEEIAAAQRVNLGIVRQGRGAIESGCQARLRQWTEPGRQAFDD